MHMAYLIRMHMAEDPEPSIGIVCEPIIGSGYRAETGIIVPTMETYHTHVFNVWAVTYKKAATMPWLLFFDDDVNHINGIIDLTDKWVDVRQSIL